MNQTVNIDVQVDHKSINQLEEELAAVNAELKKASQNDPKFKEYAQEAQMLTKELDKANTAAEGFTSEKKFQAADGAIKLMAGTLSGVVGTLGLIGVESEVFGEMEQKAASAIAVAMGIKDISEGFNQVKTAVAGVIPKLAAMNATMLLNPAVLIAAGIAALGTAIYFLSQQTTPAEEAMEDLNVQIEDAKKNLDGTIESYERLTQLELESFELEKKILQQKIERDAAQGVFFKGREKEMEFLDKEIKKRKEVLEVYKESTQATKDYIKGQIDETANIKDQIALYGDERSESGLIALKIKLKKIELERTDDYERQRDILREIAVLEMQMATAKEFEDQPRGQVEKLETEPKGVELGLTPEAQLILASDKAVGESSDALTQRLANNAYTAAEAAKQAEQEKIDAQLMTLSNMEYVAGSETKIGKALLIARQLMLAKKLVMDVKDYIMEVKMNALKAKSNLIVGQSKAAATLNPLVISMFAVQAISIYRSIREALKASKQSDTGGDFETTPTMDTRRGETININPDQVQQLSATNQQTVKAYVVQGDTRSASEAEAKIQNRRTLD